MSLAPVGGGGPGQQRGLSVMGLSARYPSRSRRHPSPMIVEDIGFTLEPGQSLGLVGESGSGKSTIALCVAGLLATAEGSITLDGVDVSKKSLGRRTPAQRRIQMVFQSSSGCLNPRRTVGHSVGLPLVCAREPDVKRRVSDLLEQVGLRAADAQRLPHEFSGGQRQRVNIARALALNPDVIVCDEPTTGLDVSVQAQICNLLLEIARIKKTSYLFISHDLAVVQLMTERVMVLNHGRVVDSCESSKLPRSQNIYTQMLIDAIPGNGGRARVGNAAVNEPLTTLS
jgi:peptide/nickel transport system ATP-binding protein